eukprot:5533943-Prymnesium_polylepis.1
MALCKAAVRRVGGDEMVGSHHGQAASCEGGLVRPNAVRSFFGRGTGQRPSRMLRSRAVSA